MGTCRSIKFCVKLMSKLLKYIAEEKVSNSNLLLKNKLFLKITQLIIENANESLKNAENKQKELFTMILHFTEKIQEQLFILTNSLIKSSISQRNLDNQNLNKNIIGLQKL